MFCKNVLTPVKGTRDFLAVEAADRRYLYLPPMDKKLREARRKALVEGRMKDLARLQEHGLPPRFFHNDLHDLESLWWIAVWKLFNYGAKSEASLTSVDLKARAKQRQLARNSLFPPSDETLRRTLFLQTNVHYWDYLAWLRWDALKKALGN